MWAVCVGVSGCEWCLVCVLCASLLHVSCVCVCVRVCDVCVVCMFVCGSVFVWMGACAPVVARHLFFTTALSCARFRFLILIFAQLRTLRVCARMMVQMRE